MFERNEGPPEAGSRGTAAPKMEKCRVLLVEDDEDDRAYSKHVLEQSDDVAEVKCFENGEELVKYMREQGFEDHSVMCMTPTVIIVDINMPRMDGFAVLSRLKADRFLEEIPVVVLSGKLDYGTIRRALDLRADGVLRKPLKVSKITEYLRHGWQWPTQEMWMA